MLKAIRHPVRSAAGTLHDALEDSADDLQTPTPVGGHNHRMTFLIIAGTGFLLGLLWAKARARTL